MAYKYQKLYEELKGMAERLPEQAQMPSVRNIMEAYGVSQATVDKALDSLRADRIVEAVGGEGLFVMRKDSKRRMPQRLKICMAQSDYPSILFALLENAFEDFFTKAGHEFQVVRYPWSKGLSAMLKPGLMDVFIAMPSVPELSEKELAFLKSLDIHSISLLTDASRHGIDSIFVDAELGGMLAAEHLIKLGHKRLAFLRGEPDSPLSRGKFNGFRRQCALAGIPAPRFIDCDTKPGEYSLRAAYAAFSKVLKEGRPDFSAMMADSDHCGVGVIRACHENGVRIPKDLSLVGFNGTPESEFSVPSQTTVKQDFSVWPEVAYEIISARLVGGIKDATAKMMPPSLLVRESSAQAPK